MVGSSGVVASMIPCQPSKFLSGRTSSGNDKLRATATHLACSVDVSDTMLSGNSAGKLVLRIHEIASRCLLGCGLMTAILGALGGAEARQLKVLHDFKGKSDGRYAYAGLVADKVGNLYGTTGAGGTNGLGTVFEITATGSEMVLYSFARGTDGNYPGGLLLGSNGNLYGVTTYGGGTSCNSAGCGTVFQIDPHGNETVLYRFNGGTDGNSPLGRMVSDTAGNLYGLTNEGGGSGCYDRGCGTVFKISTDGSESVIHSFTGSPSDGAVPFSSFTADQDGNLYGTTNIGGANNYGTVFKVAADGTETVLYSFMGGSDGYGPYSGVVSDSSGNLYGTTTLGGSSNCSIGCGTIFKLAPDGTKTLLYTFCGPPCRDGANPWSSVGLISDSGGNLYGTTLNGGGSSNCASVGCGTIFKLSPNGKETVLYGFDEWAFGIEPYSDLILDGAGNLFGTTSLGGDTNCHEHHAGHDGCGIVFELKK